MASIDERVVAMSFENSKFEAGVAQTMTTLGKLNETLSKLGATSGLSKIEAEASKITLTAPMSALDKLKQKLGLVSQGSPEAFGEISRAGSKVTLEEPASALDKLKQKIGLVAQGAPEAFGEIERAGSKVTLEGVVRAIDNVASKFSVLEGAAAVALGNITSRAALAGGQFAKSLSLGPVTQGFEEYSTNLNSIQTILANTKVAGTGLKDVNRALQELNHYSDQTIYNFSQMANAVGLFTAAGVDLKTSVSAIKGISNLAALSGSNNEKATHAMTQLSQAIAAGKVTMQDWISVRNAGMGGSVFQRALAQTAEAMGTIKKGAVDLVGPMKNVKINGEAFTESIRQKPGQKSWLTSKVLTTTLAQFTGDLKDADLAAMGFNQHQIDAIQETAKSAKAAATEVKTLPQVFDVARETIGSGWSATFQAIFGNFTEAKKTFTGMSQALNGIINDNANARNKILKGWRELGGRDILIGGIKGAFEDLGKILGAIGDAFREIFPRKTSLELFQMTESFSHLMTLLQPSEDMLDKLKRTFAGFFAVLHIGWSVLRAILGVIGDLFGVISDNSGGFFAITASLGDWLVAVDTAITKGGSLNAIFKSLGAVLAVPLEILKALASVLIDMFGGTDPKKAKGVSDSMSALNEALLPLRGILDQVTKAWDKFVQILDKVRETVEPAFTAVLEFLGRFGDFVAERFEAINWDRALAALQTGLIAGIFLKLKQALSGGLKIDFGGDALKNLGAAFGALTNNIRAMQRTIQVATLFEIAAAIALLAAGIFTLSTIPSEKLSRAMSAVAIGLAQLVGAMLILTKVGTKGFGSLPFIAGSMILLAIAVTILAAAMKIMATMDWEELAKGLIGIGGAIAAVGLAAQLMNGPKILVAAAALIPLAFGLNLLAVAMKIFATMSFEEIGKGLEGVVLGLAAVALGVSIMPPNLILIGPGLVAVAFGLSLMAGAIGAFGNMDLKALVQGVLGVAASLLAIGYSVSLIPPTVIAQAAGLVVLALALNGIAAAVAIFGHMDIGTLVKGLIALSVTLDLLAIGLIAMEGTLPGSAALLAAAAAFAILGPAIAFMGQLKWSTLLKGLAAMAITLTLLAVAGALAAGPITALGLGLAVLGGGMLAISLALSLFILALAQLGSKGPRAIAAMVAAFGAFLLILPKMIIDFVKGLVVILQEITKLAPAIAKSLVSIVGTLLDGLASLAPKIRTAISALVVAILGVLADNTPRIVAAGYTLLISFLTGIRDNITQVISLATDIVVKFLMGVADSAPKIVAAGAYALDKFLNGIIGHLPKVLDSAAKLVITFIKGITSHISGVVGAVGKLMLKFIATILGFAPKLVKVGAEAVVNFLRGIGDAIPKLVSAGLRTAKRFLFGVADGLAGMAEIGFKAIIRFLHGLEKAIRENFDDLFRAGEGVADAIIDGLVQEFGRLAPVLNRALKEVFSALPHWAKKILGIASPSKVFAEIGKFTMLGFIEGVKSAGPGVKSSINDAAKSIVETASDTLGKVPSLLDGLMETEPVITPVLDLSQVKRDAKGLTDLTNVTPITAAASYSQAAVISDAQQTQESGKAAKAETTIMFEQNNTSPEALSDVEIYRQTRNQLSQLKEGLGLVTA